MLQAMQLTGGYVGWLRDNGIDLYSTIVNPEWALRLCTRLGKFVAYMRARPSYRQEETAEREFSTRLVSQLVRLAKSLALVLNRPTVDDEVMRRVRRVALDTARGQTYNITKYLYEQDKDGALTNSISSHVSKSDERTRSMLRFMKLIGIVELFTPDRLLRLCQRWQHRVHDL